MGRGTAWSKEETELVRANLFLPNEVLAEKIGRTPDAIRNFRKKLFPGRGGPVRPVVAWTDEELELLRETLNLPSKEVCEVLGRSEQSVRNARIRVKRAAGIPVHKAVNPTVEIPPVKAPGDYIELLDEFIVSDAECMRIWLKWNGYASYRTLDCDKFGWVSLLCTAKG